MSAVDRVGAEFVASARSFLRRRTAVFFTFFFPVLLIAIFAGLIRVQPTGGGLFSKPTGYYVPAYLAVVVLFTPLSRVGSEVARHVEGNRFEKLATTPLAEWEWLLAQTLVNVALIVVAAVALVVALLVLGASFALSPWLAAFVVVTSVLFCGVGAILGSLADSRDGAISMSNGVALPLLFLSDTFVEPSLFPAWFRPLLDLSPLTYFARGVRQATYAGGSVLGEFVVVCVLAVAFFALATRMLPWASE
ncbi:ABC transporter permease [Halospeciosus flavus]|uniref:ABC transporter permease n=1 Tax=Halospeciosus flavus TaxID=3032283 RepID=A0ABD5Z486_9EURY|nr:ABC transporter permease [Halospeciosus flavus]